jgi:hypothetical protein
MKKTALIALLCIILMTSSAFAGVVEDAQSDYQWKLFLVTEQTQRLDMWYATNAGKEITKGSLSYLKSLTDEFVLRENNAIESGRKYRNALIGNIDNYNREWVLAEINRTEKNEEIFSNDKEFSSLAPGLGKNVKSKSYTLTFDHTDRYYIVVDNSIQPAGGAEPSGEVDVKIKIVKEEPLSSKSTPGFEAFYSVLIIAAFFCFLKKDKLNNNGAEHI